MREALALGAKVLAVARDPAGLAAFQASLPAPGDRLAMLAADAASATGQEAMLAAAVRAFGGVDSLVANVGTNLRRAAVDYPDEEFQHLLHTNVTSVFGLARRAHPVLRERSDPSVVFIGSVAGRVSVGTGVPYAATKAALDMLAKGLADEWAADGIRVNVVAPWFTDTPLVAPLLERPGFRERVIARTPLGRIAKPAEVARAALFFLMPAASYVTGQSLAVDGGFTARGW